jgi:soluble lytic murein transglycosylase-like protein
VRRPLISKAILILSVTCALSAPAHAQQVSARRNSDSGPVKIRVHVAGITGDVRARAAQYEGVIAAAAARNGVDPRLLWTIAFLESRFRPGVVSYKNGQPCAYGMMQFIPSTAQQYGLQNPFDPRASIEAAGRYVRDLAARFGGRADLILASYNAGEGAVEAYQKGISIRLSNGRRVNPRRLQTGGIPPYAETRNYVSRGLSVAEEISQANIFSQLNLAAAADAAGAPRLPPSRHARDSMTEGTSPSATQATPPEPAPRTPVSSYASGNQPLSAERTEVSSDQNKAAPQPTVARSLRATRAAAQNGSSSRIVASPDDSLAGGEAPATVTTKTRSTYVGGASQR